MGKYILTVSDLQGQRPMIGLPIQTTKGFLDICIPANYWYLKSPVTIRETTHT